MIVYTYSFLVGLIFSAIFLITFLFTFAVFRNNLLKDQEEFLAVLRYFIVLSSASFFLCLLLYITSYFTGLI